MDKITIRVLRTLLASAHARYAKLWRRGFFGDGSRCKVKVQLRGRLRIILCLRSTTYSSTFLFLSSIFLGSSYENPENGVQDGSGNAPGGCLW